MVLTTEVLPRCHFQLRWSRTASPHPAPPILWPRRKAARSRLGLRGRKVSTAPLNVLLQEWMEWMVHVYGTLLWWSSTICTRPDTHCVISTCWSVVVLCMCVESACTLSGRPRTRVTACRGASLRILRALPPPPSSARLAARLLRLLSSLTKQPETWSATTN